MNDNRLFSLLDNKYEFLFDSRSLNDPNNTVFCAISTQSADGHNFINAMYRNGVRKFIVEKFPESIDSMHDAEFFVVDNVRTAIESLAKEKRKRLKGKVIGITGSAGKTVVKELLYKNLTSSGLAVSRSPRSWNSRLGAPLSILEASTDDDIVIVEVGIDTMSDMDQHALTISPDIGILTSITTAHDKGFESREKKIREKLLLFSTTPIIIYDANDSQTDSIVKATFSDRKLIGVTGDNKNEIDVNLAEKAGKSIENNITFNDAEFAINRIDVHEGINDCVMLFDDFTNDIGSLRWSLDFMRRRTTPTRSSTVILSDLFHGPLSSSETDKLYSDLGRLLNNFGVDRLIAIGKEITDHAGLIPKHISVEKLLTPSDFLESYDINRFSSETILISGSPANEFRQIRALLETPRHDTILEINLDSIVHNFNYYRSLLNPKTKIAAMVKASAYGTGAVEIAKTLQSQGAGYLAVAVIDEGIELRKEGITMPIMVLNPVTTNYRALFKHNLEPSVFSLRELDILVDEAKKAEIDSFSAHIKLDTGMHRVGFSADTVDILIEKLKNNPNIHVASIFSHLATADCPDQDNYTKTQLELFDKLSSRIAESLPYPILRHILNTAGILTHPEYQFDMVRLGIGLYGISPLNDNSHLHTVATLKTTIISLHRHMKGESIGYGRATILTRNSIVATLPIGYADGINRHLGRGNAEFMVKGVKCPILGNVCMDQCMIDVTDVVDPAIGDVVEIFGENIPIETIAKTLDTIPYEILTSISPRVKRIYFRD